MYNIFSVHTKLHDDFTEYPAIAGMKLDSDFMLIQSTLVISTSIISNNSLSRRENMVLVLTQKSEIRLQNIVEKR